MSLGDIVHDKISGLITNMELKGKYQENIILYKRRGQ
jgi:hypothetical protein